MTRALFIPTLVSGVTYWRMFNPVNAGIRNKSFDGHLLWWQRGLNEMHPWQRDILDLRYRERITGEIQSCCREADVVVMGMLHLPPGLSTMQGIRECYGKPVVMEIDDNILSCPVYNPAAGSYSPGNPVRDITLKQMRESDAVIVSTPYLKEIYSEFNDNIYVLPNAIDFKAWGKVQMKRRKGKIVIGWVGGANHNDDLLIIEPAIDYLTAKYPQVEFVFGHGMNPKFRGKKGVRHIEHFSRIDKYPHYIGSLGIDIGVAPLVDNAFNRGKSNLRWLEYSALNTPCVASRVGHMAETIKDGEDGLLCDGEVDFIRHLETLINDSARRRELGRKAYARVFRDFNIDIVCKDYANTLRHIADKGQIKRETPAYKESNFKQTVEAV